MNIASLTSRLKEIEGRIVSASALVNQFSSAMQQQNANLNALHGSKQEIEFWLGELGKVIAAPNIGTIADVALDAVTHEVAPSSESVPPEPINEH